MRFSVTVPRESGFWRGTGDEPLAEYGKATTADVFVMNRFARMESCSL